MLAFDESVLVALFDETIQIFGGRGPSVGDIRIDIADFSCGCLLIAATVAVIKRIGTEKGEK